MADLLLEAEAPHVSRFYFGLFLSGEELPRCWGVNLAALLGRGCGALSLSVALSPAGQVRVPR